MSMPDRDDLSEEGVCVCGVVCVVCACTRMCVGGVVCVGSLGPRPIFIIKSAWDRG